MIQMMKLELGLPQNRLSPTARLGVQDVNKERVIDRVTLKKNGKKLDVFKNRGDLLTSGTDA